MAQLPTDAVVSADVAVAEVAPHPMPVDVTPPGHAIDVRWVSAPGADRVEVDEATLVVGPHLREAPLGDVPLRPHDDGYVVTVPQGPRPVRRLGLHGLQRRGDSDEWVTVRSEGDLGDLRLVVTVQGDEGFGAPLLSVPPVAPGGMLPDILTGAGLRSASTGGVAVLTLPDVEASALLLTLAMGDSPQEFEPLEFRLSSVTAVAADPPSGLEVVDSSDEAVWTFPTTLEQGKPDAEADLSQALKRELEDTIGDMPDGAELHVTLRLRGAGRPRVAFRGASGALIRTVPGVLSVTLAGEARRLPVPAPQLAGEGPDSVAADLTVRYHGIRLLPHLSDPVPPRGGGVRGAVVQGEPTVRSLPPESLGDLPVARVGVIGRAATACELAVELRARTAGEPLGPPGIVSLDASAHMGITWVDMPELPAEVNAIRAISVRANHGRFLWAAGDGPLVRIAVHDPDPPPRPLRLGGRHLVTVDATGLHQPACTLPADAFSGAAPQLECDLFVTVDVSDLAVRYRR